MAESIAQARDAAGLTQRQLARILRWPHSSIGLIEAKRQQVTVPELVAIADAIGIEPTELVAMSLRLNSGRAAVRSLYKSRRLEELARKRAAAAKRPRRGASH